MTLSDISVKRPVLATVISLVILVLGLVSYTHLPLREMPAADPPVVSVETNYRGASAAIIETRITQLLEDAIAGIEGVDTLTSSSQNGRSSISVEFSLARDIESATNDVRDAVSRVGNNLPAEADPPQVAKVGADAEVIMWLNFSAAELSMAELTDYADRYLLDRFSSIDGVARVIIGGAQRFAMRIWLKPKELAARGLTVSDVAAALRRENIELPAGRIESLDRDFTVRLMRSYNEAEDFAALSIAKGSDGHVVRLDEVAEVKLESVDRRSDFRGNGVTQLGLGIVKTSTANTLAVARVAKAKVAEVAPTLPEGMNLIVGSDNSVFVETAVKQVFFTLLEAMLLVLAVIYLFLGSKRAAIIPAVTVPVCLVGAFIALDAFGFSINLLTLLALVLSIGLVVDDAIVVLENCQRRVDLGEPRLVAAYRGTRQVSFAVIATTAVLIAVFVPIAFMQGIFGPLFRELALTIAAAVFISSIVALSLSPAMCSLLLVPHDSQTGLSRKVDNAFRKVSDRYAQMLKAWINRPKVFGAVLLGAIALSAILMYTVPRELVPPEDRGSFFVMINAPEGAGYDYTLKQAREVETLLLPLIDEEVASRVMLRTPRSFGGAAGEEMHTAQAIVNLKPWNERDASMDEVLARVRKDLDAIPGVRALPQVRQGLGRGFGSPLQFVMGGSSYQELVLWRDRMLARASENPNLVGLDSDYKETRPQMRIQIDRARAADLGVTVEEIGSTLETVLGGRRVTTFTVEGEEYDVLLQGQLEDRREPADLAAIHVRASRSGELIPLSNLVTLTELAEPGTFNRFNRLRTITLSATLAPGYPLGDALDYMKSIASEELPQEAVIDYKGESREYQRAGNTMIFTFAMALLVVYLVLAAQFESFIHPFVIMLTVPLAVLGAMLGLWLFGSTLNLYSQIGIVILVGLAAKNGILIVEFANQLRDLGRDIQDAVLESAQTRLRPIVMTSIATSIGALPLLLASGAGSASRQTIGVVIVFGVMLSTLLSLFVVPAFYVVFAPFTSSPEAVSRKLESLESLHPETEKAQAPG